MSDETNIVEQNGHTALAVTADVTGSAATAAGIADTTDLVEPAAETATTAVVPGAHAVAWVDPLPDLDPYD